MRIIMRLSPDEIGAELMGWDGINYGYWCRHSSKVCSKARSFCLTVPLSIPWCVNAKVDNFLVFKCTWLEILINHTEYVARKQKWTTLLIDHRACGVKGKIENFCGFVQFRCWSITEHVVWKQTHAAQWIVLSKPNLEEFTNRGFIWRDLLVSPLHSWPYLFNYKKSWWAFLFLSSLSSSLVYNHHHHQHRHHPNQNAVFQFLSMNGEHHLHHIRSLQWAQSR